MPRLVEVLVPPTPLLSPRATRARSAVRLAALGLALVAIFAVGGCPSGPAAKPERSHTRHAGLVPEPPAVVPFDPATRRLTYPDAALQDPATERLARLERAMWRVAILPLKPREPADTADVLRGLGLGDVLARQLVLMNRDAGLDASGPLMMMGPTFGIASFFDEAALFASGDERKAWFADPAATLPSGLARTDIRWLVGGNLVDPARDGQPPRVFLWLMDRVEGKTWSGAGELDLPRLQRPRLLLLRLLTEAGQAPSEVERGDMVWSEELDDSALQALGSAAIARAWHDPVRARAAAADLVAKAPWSYTANLVAARVASDEFGACTAEVVQALDRALSLNPHADFFFEADALACNLGALVGDIAGQLFIGLGRAGAMNCAVSGKAVASIGGGREVPGSGFLAGVGGFYRGGSCSSETHADLAELARKADDAFVAAGLFIDAAVAAIGDGRPDQAESLLDDAEKALDALPATPSCLPRLYRAEAALHRAGIGLQAGRLDDARQRAAAARELGLACQDPRLGARADNLIGLAEQAAGRYDRALTAFRKAQAVFDELLDDMNLAVTFTNIGWTRALLGQPKKALPDLERALALKRAVRSDGGVAVALENLGVTLMTLGRFAEAEPHFIDAQALTRDPASLAAIANNLARIRAGQGRRAEASKLLDDARRLAAEAKSRALQAQIEQTTGGIEAEQGDLMASMASFNAALVIRREVGDRAGEGLTLSSLMVVAERLHRPGLAIVYGKLAVAAHQEVKASASGIDPEAERAFQDSRAKTYRRLADLLIGEGRLIEAERVLALLKLDEAETWTRAASSSSAAVGMVPLTVSERDLDEQYRKIADKVMASGRAYGELAAKFPLTPDEEKRLGKLRGELGVANAKFGKFLASLATKSVDARGLTDLREDAGIGPDLAELPGTIAVYTLVGDDA